MIKRIAALVISILMLTSLAAAQTSNYTGTWHLNSMEMDGVTLSPADVGMEMIMILYDDGTAELAMTDEMGEAGSWVLDGETLTVTVDGDPLDFALTAEGKLVAEMGDTTMVLGRDKPEQSFTPAPEIPANDISDFDGTWTVSMVKAFGMTVPFAAMGDMGLTDPTIIIQNGTVTTFGEMVETGVLADGKLVIESVVDVTIDETADETADDTYDEAFGKTFSLLEDGTMSMDYMEIIFYCEKVEVTE